MVIPTGPRTAEEWASHPMALAMLESTLQTNVMACLRLFGWRAYHTHDSRRSDPGFPDVCAVRARDGRLLFAELKRQKPKPTIPQQQWLDDLTVVSAYAGSTPSNRDRGIVDVYVWRPADWLSGDIERVLR